MYDNEYKTKESKNWTKDKIEPQHLYEGSGYRELFTWTVAECVKHLTFDSN